VVEGKYWTAERFLLQTTIKESKQMQRNCGVALNDVVLYSGDVPRMIDFEIYVDDQFLCSHHADGVIIATPTGSTAYSLSAGGPIIQPNVDAIVMIPMLSHSLTARPIIIPSNSQVRIEFSAQNEAVGKLNCNINEIVDIAPGTSINIEQARQKIILLHPLDYNYYESLRCKLHWGHQLTS
jgi:NAD+ kinase